jgi:uncharacterized protein YidB (DUF937 family)
VTDLADHLGLSPDELARHLFRLVPTTINGGARTTTPRGHLHLI